MHGKMQLRELNDQFHKHPGNIKGKFLQRKKRGREVSEFSMQTAFLLP